MHYYIAALGFQLVDSYGTYKAQMEYSPCNSSSLFETLTLQSSSGLSEQNKKQQRDDASTLPRIIRLIIRRNQ